MRLSPLVASVLALGLALGACSQSKDPSAKDLRSDVSAQLQEGEDGLTESQADCYAKLLVDEIGVKRLNDIDFQAKEPSKDLEEDFAAVAVTARTTCKIDTP
jgi:hypothetical protein